MPTAGVENANTFREGNQSVWGVAQHLFRGGVGHYARVSEDARATDVAPLLGSEGLYLATAVGFCALLAGLLLYVCLLFPDGDLVAESHAFWAVVIAIVAVLPFSWTHYAFFLLFPLVGLLADGRQRIASVIGLGVWCLLCTLVHRFYAWLPPSALLLNFVFVATLLMLLALVTAIRRPAS
jgi:hypothetical protein